MTIIVKKKKKRGEGKHPKPKRQWHPSYLGSLTSKEAADIHNLRKLYDNATAKELELSKMNRDRAEKAKKGTKKKSKPARKRPVLVEGFPVKRKKKKTPSRAKTLLYRGKSVLNKKRSRGI